MTKIIIHTDGSSKGNPGPGGWAGVIEIRDTSNEIRVKEIGGREELTTNNRMELTAAIEALREVDKGIENQENGEVEVEIFSDSEYLIKGITMWIWGWQKNNWRTKDRKDVLNKDLWEALLNETEKRKVEWKKVKGHSGYDLNDRCDLIATTFADGEKMKLFEGSMDEYKKLFG